MRAMRLNDTKSILRKLDFQFLQQQIAITQTSIFCENVYHLRVYYPEGIRLRLWTEDCQQCGLTIYKVDTLSSTLSMKLTYQDNGIFLTIYEYS